MPFSLEFCHLTRELSQLHILIFFIEILFVLCKLSLLLKLSQQFNYVNNFCGWEIDDFCTSNYKICLPN